MCLLITFAHCAKTDSWKIITCAPLFLCKLIDLSVSLYSAKEL